MQQFQNPNYTMYQQAQYNPYMQRIENLQQFQQAIQQPVVPTSMSGANQFVPLGKIVESVDMVKATDIPMDGNMYYFPKADGTEIYVKQWLSNGTTQILCFKPLLETEPNNSSSETFKTEIKLSDEVTEVFMNKFDEINKRLEDMEVFLNKNSTKTNSVRNKKEADSNE